MSESNYLFIEPNNAQQTVNQDRELTFALDVGTRSVTGIVGYPESGIFHTMAIETRAYENRAMYDGQIHSIGEVTGVVMEVRQRLEQSLGVTLKKVSIAAAGRSLLTTQAEATRSVDPETDIDNDLIWSCEIEALQKAQQEIDKKPEQRVGGYDSVRYYCVGYTTVQYYLDGYPISSLLGHHGSEIRVVLLGTFLPHAVVDSLYTVMNRAGLEVANLTLEPIAAIGVTIPRELRKLNLALVDIGAGTSDIAITKNGAVVAYGMVAEAGDEITDYICEHYLVDFLTGEQIKALLSGKDEQIRFTDILGKDRQSTKTDILNTIAPELDHLAELIGAEIIKFNTKPPAAVFLVGGGCQVPGFEKRISNALKIGEDRVAIHNRSVIKNLDCSFDIMSGPDSITPFGIATGSAERIYNDFMSVIFNGKQVRLLNVNRPTLIDILVLTGYEPGKLIGKSGAPLHFKLNGVEKMVRGGHGTAAVIRVNGQEASIESVLNYGDDIQITEAVNGTDAKLTAEELLSDGRSGVVQYSGEEYHIGPKVHINGAPASITASIADGDQIDLLENTRIQDFLSDYGIEMQHAFFKLNGVRVGVDRLMQPGDDLQVFRVSAGEDGDFDKNNEEKDGAAAETVTDAPIDTATETMSGVADMPDKPQLIAFPTATSEGFRYQMQVKVNGADVMIGKNNPEFLLVDVFNFIEIDIEAASQSANWFQLIRNGESATLIDKLENGDIVEIIC